MAGYHMRQNLEVFPLRLAESAVQLCQIHQVSFSFLDLKMSRRLYGHASSGRCRRVVSLLRTRFADRHNRRSS